MKIQKNQRFLVSQRQKSFRKILPILLALLLIPIALAQDLEVSIVSYTPETGSARLRIYNPTDNNYNDLKYNIDNQEQIDIVERLASKIAVSIFPTLTPGNHDIIITSSNGLKYKQTLKFGSSEEQLIKQKQELSELNKKQLELIKPQLEQEIQGIENAKERRPYVITAIILTILILIIYYIIRKIRE